MILAWPFTDAVTAKRDELKMATPCQIELSEANKATFSIYPAPSPEILTSC